MPKDAPPILWEPTEDRIANAAVTRFARWVEARHGIDLPDYAALWEWSTEHLDDFWRAVWDHFEVDADGDAGTVLASREMPGAEWFPGTRLSLPEHVFRGKDDATVAILHAGELRELREITWGELRDQVARIAAGLARLGVGEGDRVVAYVPNIPEAMAAFLATTSLGAVWSSCSPDFGAKSAVDRFAQIEPKVLLTVDGYRYGGKDHDRRDTVAKLRDAMPSLEATVLLPYLDADATLDGARTWAELTAEAAELTFTRVPFDHPLWVLYSSGTTGLPKGIVHGHGGILLEHLKTMHLHLDAQAGDRVFWYSTTGWMMWNFLAGVLLTPAAVVLYDGSPGTPDLGVLWDLAEAAGITCFGTSAAFIASCKKQGVRPRDGRALAALDSVGSTGSPLAPEGFRWIYEELGTDTWLFSTSGGTDLCTAFVGGVPTLPVYEGELQARALGARVEAWSDDGEPVIDEVGELVVTEPMPSMPLFLWGDEDGSRMRESYFEMFPGVWRHGDWIEITSRGTAIISGRSDSTINRGGIRMGTSEIYSAVLALDEVMDALVVDVDGWMPMWVVLAEGAELDDDLTQRIARRIREDCSPRHVPNEVHVIAEIPRTLSGKVLEVPVKRILQGTAPDQAASKDSLQNPDALEPFVELARERGAA